MRQSPFGETSGQELKHPLALPIERAVIQREGTASGLGQLSAETAPVGKLDVATLFLCQGEPLGKVGPQLQEAVKGVSEGGLASVVSSGDDREVAQFQCGVLHRSDLPEAERHRITQEHLIPLIRLRKPNV